MRFLWLLVSILFISFLSACTDNSGTRIEPHEDNMIINIINNANFDFYGLEISIVDDSGSFVSSGGVVNANGSKIEKGESLRFELLEKDYSIPFDGREVKLEVGVINKEQEIIDINLINGRITLNLESNKEIVFEMTGDLNKVELKKVK